MKETIQELATLAAAALLTLMLVTSGTLAAEPSNWKANCLFTPLGMVDEPMTLQFMWVGGASEAKMLGNVGVADVAKVNSQDSLTFFQQYKDNKLGVLVVSTTTINLPDSAPADGWMKASHMRNFYIPRSDALNVSAYEGKCTIRD